MAKKSTVIVMIVAVLLAAAGIWWLMQKGPSAPVDAASSPRQGKEGRPALADAASSPRQDETWESSVRRGEDAASAGADDAEQTPTEEEKAEAAAEAKVEAFDNLTDKWMDPSEKGVSMQDVSGFVEAFRQVPKDRQDECIHRALNLVPDENVMLLVGVLTDKTMDKEIVETVFNDILNRDEDVKKPILQQVFKDKKHPCWADTAWILDVTGQIPAK